MNPLQVQRLSDSISERSRCLLIDVTEVLQKHGYKSIKDRDENYDDHEDTGIILAQVLKLVETYAEME